MNTGFAEKNGTDVFGTVGVAMITPFDEDNRLDVATGRKLAAHLTSRGVDALILGGTTGESPTTTQAEKITFIKEIRAEVGDDIAIVAGASTNNTAASQELARASRDAGADALLLVTPYYSKPCQEGVYQHFRAIADSTDAPVCIYDIPGRSAIPVESDTMRRLAEHEKVQAVKDAKGDLVGATTLIAETGLAWYSGDDPLNLPWLSLGASGFISVIGHVAPQQLRDLYTAFDEGDLVRAREINATLAPLVAAQGRLGGVSMAKAALQLQGINVGAPRLPQIPANDDDMTELRNNLEQAGVL
ncbi:MULTISPECIES: 4-hydroxy-tetrahydrodipicolinate synthase [Corynebacterium]|uniref:4-hydroxy-tetrahydrodipicolinate synthase n=1 Tax=Corynebacterium TaxID=1716 RepID=UPI00124C15B6|nr:MULTISPECIES: 4-hydroxy-tetrahydrodipicolinate synthase [Corynebacterium]